MLACAASVLFYNGGSASGGWLGCVLASVQVWGIPGIFCVQRCRFHGNRGLSALLWVFPPQCGVQQLLTRISKRVSLHTRHEHRVGTFVLQRDLFYFVFWILFATQQLHFYVVPVPSVVDPAEWPLDNSPLLLFRQTWRRPGIEACSLLDWFNHRADRGGGSLQSGNRCRHNCCIFFLSLSPLSDSQMTSFFACLCARCFTTMNQLRLPGGNMSWAGCSMF